MFDQNMSIAWVYGCEAAIRVRNGSYFCFCNHFVREIPISMHKTAPFFLFWATAFAFDLPCNPLTELNCVAHNPALGSELYDTLTGESPNFRSNNGPPHVTYGSDGAKLSIFARGDNPQLVSPKYIMYGRAEAEVKASQGKSVIASMYMQSDDLDEIDIGEFFGSYVEKFQTNYFVKGNISNYDRDRYHQARVDLTNGFHKFAVEWTPDFIAWSFDDKLVRKVRKTSNPHGFPASPMRLMFSLWVAGDPDLHPGTIEWAGGLADYQGLPYLMGIRNVRLVDYSSGVNYVYGIGQDVVSTRGEIFGRKRSFEDGKEIDDGSIVEIDHDGEEIIGRVPSRTVDDPAEEREEEKEKQSKAEDSETESSPSGIPDDDKFDQGIESQGCSCALYYSVAIVAVSAFFFFST